MRVYNDQDNLYTKKTSKDLVYFVYENKTINPKEA